MNSIVPQIRLNFATTSIKSVKEWVVFSFLVLLFSLLSNFAKANDIIYVDAQSNRYPIHLSEPASVQLCDLIIDKEYAISTSDILQRVVVVKRGYKQTLIIQQHN